MSLGTAIFLGILQGLTEFFPVSSSGHLALFSLWFGIEKNDLTFEVLVHMATLAAIVFYFRKDWVQLGKMMVQKDQGDFPPNILAYVIISMIPAGLVGVFLKDYIKEVYQHQAWVGVCLIATGIALLCGLLVKKDEIPMQKLSLWIVVVMGLAQALAVLPGISRSGSTIMAAVFLGLNRQAAARFSFLMAVPVIGGAGLLTVKDLFESQQAVESAMLLNYTAGFFAAMFSGFFALVFLMKLLEGKRFFYFGYYCIPLGLAVIFI